MADVEQKDCPQKDTCQQSKFACPLTYGESPETCEYFEKDK